MKEQELIVDDTLEGRSTSIEVKYRIKFDYQPAEKATSLEPGCDAELDRYFSRSAA